MLITKSLYATTLKFVRRHTTNLQDAQDITQNALMKAHLNEDTLRDKTKLKSWLYKIIMREIYSFKKFISLPVIELSYQPTTNLFYKLSDRHIYFMELVAQGFSHREIQRLTGIKQTRVMKNYLIKKLRCL
jgi:DNA-directed RNA polymerase specialized sigma24 family protein